MNRRSFLRFLAVAPIAIKLGATAEIARPQLIRVESCVYPQAIPIVYGRSPLEAAKSQINTALRHQDAMLDYYNVVWPIHSRSSVRGFYHREITSSDGNHVTIEEL